ncbi:decaprenyl-phosphate phosphoribosyltransferase [Kribbella sp. VKM Ac-2571]|uniref:decaprenyl-phosphate phosphoribosyltransferase n=1 Tax=Kribbella sp. VKM Ac-2571 TaxID=2512222 RepID=UPI00105E56DE|nr:decaprenyl-phosphate phosphoribosyltransferase [Kribbella sp. VKM Ac-2571]TDO58849.1 decaprenyl-phosphate phosphoribosyltransferase [Kribbella sp. VKM Ac-2571]
MTGFQASTATREAPGRALLRLSRPQQWHKAVTVFAAPAAAGALKSPTVVLKASIAALGFVLLAAAIYAFNDIRDAPDDRRHPRKRRRPVASGVLSPAQAAAFGVVVALLGLTIVSALGRATFGLAAAYLVAQVLYVAGLKHVAVVDLVLVALGFVLRAAAGGAATGTPVSHWFLLVSLFGAMFLVTGKRKAEHASPGNAVGRPVLAAYPTSWLDQVMTVALLGTALSYGMWAFQYLGLDVYRELLAISFLPFFTGLLRYALVVSTGRGEEPEHDIFRDPVLLLAGLVWACLVGIGLYFA